MDYCLDAGDGSASIWTGNPALDIDGDGLFDDVMADDDGDGLADHAAVDLDDDGTPEARYTDDGSGSWAAGRPGERPLRWFGFDGAEHTGGGDLDGDGVAERLFDIDRDGTADRAISDRAVTGPGSVGYVDTDGDGRWDLRLSDADGDGAADDAGPLSRRD